MTNDRLHEILKILRLELEMIDKTIRTLEAMLRERRLGSGGDCERPPKQEASPVQARRASLA